MPKYKISVTLNPVTVEIDTDDFDIFQPDTDDEIEVDPNDKDSIHDWFRENAMDHELFDIRDIDMDQISVEPVK